MERRPVSIPRAEISVEAIRYSDVRSRVEIATEIPPAVNFRNANMKILYEDLKMSSTSISMAIGLSGSQTLTLLHRQGVSMRSLNDPTNVERRMEGIKRFYADPVKVAEKNARVHAPEADLKRGETLSTRHKTDPEYRERQLGYVRFAQEAHRRIGAERRAQRAEKFNEHERLQRERYLQFAQSLRAIPAYRMLSPRQKEVIQLRFRTDGGPNLSLEQVGEVLGGLSRQAVQQYEAAALIKLGVLKKPEKRSSQITGGKK